MKDIKALGDSAGNFGHLKTKGFFDAVPHRFRSEMTWIGAAVTHDVLALRAVRWPSTEHLTMAYGLNQDGSPRCTNAEPGTFGHECGRPAFWVGRTAAGFAACFCDECRRRGHDARTMTEWRALA